jgi:hypothetical protein
MAQPELTEHMYNAILLAWLEKPSVAWVSEQLEVPASLVRRLSRNGAPEIGKGPLPPRPIKGKARDKSTPSTLPPDPHRVAARTVLARQEATEKIAKIKQQLKEADVDAAAISQHAKEAELEQELDDTFKEIEIARKRADLEEKRIANVEHRAIVADNVSRAAQEAAAATMVMDHCLQIGAIMSHLTGKLLEGIEMGEIEMPKTVSPKMLGSLTNSADRLTSAVERALKIAKGNAGEPTQVLGVQIGVMLNGCTPEELDYVTRTGQLPARLRLLTGGSD